MDKPQYQRNLIENVDSLARVLSVDKEYLVRIANRAHSFYYLHERKPKPDGSFREIYGVSRELKTIQKTIVEKIYHNIDFPSYLHGSIKSTCAPRNHITAAKSHINASLLVRMDISNFFPSLTSEVVFDIWKRFFNFPYFVAELLTKLTTFKGFLPQGAPTSPGLANLAFWDCEAAIVDRLRRNGFTYTRYVDDVTVSSKTFITMQGLSPIFNTIFGMFDSKGVKPNRNKIEIRTSGYGMTVHKLNINSGIPTMPQKERSKIRAAVHQCEMKYHEDNQSETFIQLWRSAMGRVMFMSQFHVSEAESYYERLQAIRPIGIGSEYSPK